MSARTMNLNQQQQPIVGRVCTILHAGRRYFGTVIDHMGGDVTQAKRVRVQSQGDKHGEVLMPGQYNIIEFL